ncbi:hydrogenase formation protein HypD [Stieleria varia]|uniref:Hydrogenase isoenzymes formation protein HypD n=1 Tax=Stieleria varia TaxID=2528005 RepID=A0A5C5ZVZ8_9BACT|nr:hydrogenase formation protein HypD [Stieleria varia]TWT91275.1 Hydrogenase isoenzymes formation protein HypD [Stieleria varia]
MKHVDEYRSSQQAKTLVDEIRRICTRRWALMDVCGGQTHGLLRSGIQQQLCQTVELIHGPGCPVCVTPPELIDWAVAMSHQPKTIVASFGDMLRVPGNRDSLLDARSRGGSVRIVYSPIDAVELASRHPDHIIVFFAVGFETTVPATALAVLQAAQRKLMNFCVLPAHVRVLPAMRTLAASEDNRVQGFLAAGHVCVVTGFDCYESFSNEYKTPVVVTGFEPLDLLGGILACVTQLESGEHRVENRFGRSVCRQGNLAAADLIDQVYEVADSNWRGFGLIASGGYRLRRQWQEFDASYRFARCFSPPIVDRDVCRAADVMSGRIEPYECAEFGKTCVPESPLGAPMVSSEGVCAAYFRFAPLAQTGEHS